MILEKARKYASHNIISEENISIILGKYGDDFINRVVNDSSHIQIWVEDIG